MKTHLMFEDRDFPLDISFTYRTGFTLKGPSLPPGAEDLVQDLEFTTVLDAMAMGDGVLFEVARRGLLMSLRAPAEISYRQEILADCLEHPEIPRRIYEIATEAIVRETKVYRPFGVPSPSSVLRGAIEALELFIELLRRLRAVADEHARSVGSRGMTALFSMLQHDLDDEYFATLAGHLERMKFKTGTLISARLGRQNRGTEYVLRAPNATKRGLRERMGMLPRHSLYFDVHPRDEAGARMLGELNDRGLNLVANALAQSTDHILSFLKLLCAEVAFYVGCCNLRDALAAKGRHTCTPEVLPLDDLALAYRGIYDVALALRSDSPIVGNDADADGKALVMVTGANSGGKSTLLRALGQAQMMLQCGMLVGASAYRASVGTSVFTHFIREEDATMSSGKLDEELARMDRIVGWIRPGSILLLNESFAATNEREGSEIARQIVDALLESGVRVLFVTHQYTLAHAFFSRGDHRAIFLRAERGVGGQRTYRVIEGEPLATSFGEDLYKKIGGFSTGRTEQARTDERESTPMTQLEDVRQ